MKQPNAKEWSPQSPTEAEYPAPSAVSATYTRHVPIISPAWNWWLDRTSNTRYLPRTFDERIRATRSRVGSGIFLGLIVISLALIVWERLTTNDLPTFYALLAALVGLSLGCALNRYNQVELAGALVALVIDAAIFGAVLSAPNGMLDTDYLGSYYLMALILGVVAMLMPTWALFVATAANCALILADFLVLQSYTPALTQQLAADGYFFEIGRPIFLNIGIAFAFYILVRTLLGEGRRADRAEYYAEMERRQLEQRRQLEAGVEQLLETHIRLANNDYSARANLPRDNQLWQVAVSLNNLIGRLQKSAQADYLLRRTADEAQRLNQALEEARAGRRPIWPAPSGTVIDPLIASLTGRNPPQIPPSYQALEQPPRGGASPWTSGAQPSGFGLPPDSTSGQLPGTGSLSGHQQPPPNGPSRPNEPLPSWLQPPTNSRPGGELPYDSKADQSFGDYNDNPWFLPPERRQ